MTELIPDPIQERKHQRSEAHKATTYGAFLTDLCAAGGYTRELAERAATHVLHRLEQRIRSDESDPLEAQLPVRLCELLAGCDRPLGLKRRKIHRAEFITLVAEDLELQPQEAERVVREVLGVVRQHISDGEAKKVEAQLPPDMRDFMWLPL